MNRQRSIWTAVLVAAVLALGAAGAARANNVSVSNADLVEPSGGTVKAQFDIGWRTRGGTK